MSKHTPGIWEKVSDTCVTDSDGVMLAEVYYGRPREEYSANAQLIATSPELLAALEQLLSAVEHEVEPFGRLIDGVSSAYSAIAKAEGK